MEYYYYYSRMIFSLTAGSFAKSPLFEMLLTTQLKKTFTSASREVVNARRPNFV